MELFENLPSSKTHIDIANNLDERPNLGILIYNVRGVAISGKDYTFLGKDQLEQALPSLKRKHLTYDEVAGKNIQYMVGEMLKEPAIFLNNR